MAKKAIIIFIILIGLSSLLNCSLNEKEKIGVMGYVKDELGNPLTEVSISYKTSLISVQTDSIGGFTIDDPRTLFIEFKNEGYHTFTTKIDDFSEMESYNFNTIHLKKINVSDTNYSDISINRKSNTKGSKLYGNVLDSFKKPLENVTVAIIDSVTMSGSLSKYGNKNGFFHFRKHHNSITFKKEGFKDLLIELPIYEKDNQNITLLENLNKKGIYIIKSGNYIPLPLVKLSQKSEEKIGSTLWGGNFSYKITDFFYPDNIKEFKIKNDTLIRFVIFDPDFSKHIFKAETSNGYLCTVNYKSPITQYPVGNSVNIKTIYPSKYCKSGSNEPVLIEFKPDTTGVNYAFLNSKNKKGYYFTY